MGNTAVTQRRCGPGPHYVYSLIITHRQVNKEIDCYHVTYDGDGNKGSMNKTTR